MGVDNHALSDGTLDDDHLKQPWKPRGLSVSYMPGSLIHATGSALVILVHAELDVLHPGIADAKVHCTLPRPQQGRDAIPVNVPLTRYVRPQQCLRAGNIYTGD